MDCKKNQQKTMKPSENDLRATAKIKQNQTFNEYSIRDPVKTVLADFAR